MELAYFLNLVDEHFRFVNCPESIPAKYFYKFREASYRQWAFIEIEDYVSRRLFPRKRASIDTYIYILDDFIEMAMKYRISHPEASTIFRAAGISAEEVRDLMLAMA